MKAAILVEQTKPLVIADVEVPKQLEYGQVLVRIICSGICGSQLGEIDGVKGPDKYLPHLLGHEGGGIVIDVGPGVSRVKKDDHVVMHWRRGKGIEASTPRYLWDGKLVNAGWVTTFNEYAVVSENRLTPIPENIDFEIATLMGCAVTTGFGVINNDAHLKIGESVAIFGIGGVGLCEVLGASLVSADPIIAIDIYEEKLRAAKNYGATHTINSASSDPIKDVFSICGKDGVDVAIDNTGIVREIERAYEVTCSTGRTILVGVPQYGERIRIYSLPLHFHKVIKGSHGGSSNPSVDIPKYLNLFQKGKYDIRTMISHYFKLDEINEAITLMKNGTALRCIIKME